MGRLRQTLILFMMKKTSHGVVIDPSFSPDKYISELNDKKIILESILLTHAHVDHLAGLNQLREAFPDAKFYMDKRDEELLRDPNMNLSDFLPEPIVCNLQMYGSKTEI